MWAVEKAAGAVRHAAKREETAAGRDHHGVWVVMLVTAVLVG